MIHAITAVCGVALIVISVADLVNTLISTRTSNWRWWPTQRLARGSFAIIRAIARRFPDSSPWRERLLSVFGSLLILELLVMWTTLQVIGFGLLWWGIGDVSAATSLGDSIYYSGVVFFTVGFGEIVPTSIVPRVGAIVEAFAGVISVALVVGYLPTLYGAYSERERQLMTIDAGSSERITPTALVKAWSPDANPKKLDEQFAVWEQWAAGVLETHSTVPLLTMFRSHDRQQHWIPALGLLCDAAIHAQIIMGSTDGQAYWFLRRAEAIFNEIAKGADLTPYQVRLVDQTDTSHLFRNLYAELLAHGFQLRPYDEALHYAGTARDRWAPQMEYLIDELLCPRGFWSLQSSIPSWHAMYPNDPL